MATAVYKKRLAALIAEHKKVLNIKNKPVLPGNGIYERFAHPIITREHVPLSWRYDLNPKTNPLLIERLPINCAFNAGAIEHDGKIVLVVRTEGYDRKSFFALAESRSGVDGFTYRDEPLLLGQVSEPDTNVYDMRLTRHQDGWIYGLFCTERKDTSTHDLSAATAQCGIVRTRDLKTWERLPDLVTDSAQQRNVVLHPEFVNGKYALYTRPQDSFIEAGKGGGIGWGLCDSMEKAVCKKQEVIEPRIYHTIKESKNGQGPAPIKTDKGWLHIAHAVRNTAAGLRYVLYAFMSDLKEPWKVTYRPGGMLIGPMGAERLGDVSNVVFSNGAVARKNGEILIYYASSDTRMHVARTSIDRLVDYCMNTPADPLFSHKCVEQRIDLIRKNKAFLKKNPIKGID